MDKPRYSSVSSDDDVSEPLTGIESVLPTQKTGANRRIITFLVAGGISILLLGWVIRLIVEARHYRQQFEWVPCGETAASARAAGCHYEPMQRSWIPEACYFNEPSDEYNPFSDREWYQDVNMTIPSNMDRLRSGDEEDAYTRYFHDEHCLYAWRKLAIAVEKKLPMIDSKSYDMHHTAHCAKTIAGLIARAYDPKNGWWFQRDYTHSPLMFQTCVPLTWA
ncbi:hypothetical protein F5884DRAFT_677224 [Xylogone sp. PMI_703]|nr:hypothetical protein F5884DRAFT_677224 [Xylogone sp. PMI_703]